MGTGSLPVGGSHRINVGDDGGNWAQNTASSHTGTTTETQLARILIPGGYLGPNGEMDIHMIFTNNNSANDKTIKVKLGNPGDSPVTLLTHTNTTDTFDFGHIYLTNRNDEAVNMLIVADFNLAPAGITDDLAIDTSQELELTVTGTLETGTDTITLEAVHVVMTYRD